MLHLCRWDQEAKMAFIMSGHDRAEAAGAHAMDVRQQLHIGT